MFSRDIALQLPPPSHPSHTERPERSFRSAYLSLYTRRVVIAMSAAGAEEPGAPTTIPTNMPTASDKSIANEVKQRVPNKVVSLASTPDRLLLRLNKYVLTWTVCEMGVMLTQAIGFLRALAA